MRIPLPLFSIAWIALVSACASPSGSAGSDARALDLSRERQLVDGARASTETMDLAAARIQASEAIAALLSRETDAGDANWLELLDAAGRVAWDAQDAGGARSAWERVLAERTKRLPDDHPDLQTARLNVARTLFELGDLRGARSLQETALAVRSRSLSDDDPGLQDARRDLARTLYTLGDLPAARSLQEKVLEVRSRTLHEDHLDLQRARLDLAVTLQAVGDLDTARALEEKALEVEERTLPADHPELQRARLNVGNARWIVGDLAGARALFEQVLEARSRTLPDEHPALQSVRLNYAATLFALGDIEGARVLQERVLEILTRTLPDDHPELQVVRQAFAGTLAKLGDLRSALVLQEKVFEIGSRTLPEDHPSLRSARVSLATMKYELGDLEGARALLERALAIEEPTLPDDDLGLQSTRQALAIVKDGQGDLEGARVLYEKSYEVLARTLPEDHPDLQSARLNLAGAMNTLGDFQGARAIFEKLVEVQSRTLPEDHPDLQMARGNLAVSLKALGDLQGARELEETVLAIRSRSLPDDHPDLQLARLNLAITYELLGELAAARTLQEKVLEVSSNTLPDDHPELQRARLALGATLYGLGEFLAARALFETVLEVRLRTLPDEHPDLQAARGNVAYAIAGQRAAARDRGEPVRPGEAEDDAEVFARTTRSFTRGIARAARLAVLTGSAREAEERCTASLPDLGRALSFAAGMDVFERDEELEREAFVLSEESRGAALASARLARSARSEPLYAGWHEEMRSASEELARIARSGGTADEMDAARARRERAERELLVLARGLPGGGPALLEFDPRALSVSLPDRVALVGYRRYTRTVHEIGGSAGPRTIESLCAFVLRSGDRLDRVELGPAEAIETAVSALRREIGAGGGRGLGVDATKPSDGRSDREAGSDVRRLIFDPLLPVLDGVDRIVVALDDLLHLVPLDALPSGNPSAGAPGTELLGDRWRIETRCTLSELAWKEAPAAGRESLLALGDASFQSAPRTASGEADTRDGSFESSTRAAALLRGGAWEGGFEPLTGTGPEARGIADLYDEAFGHTRRGLVLVKEEASRAALVGLAPEARFLHVATHGWFAPESVRSLAAAEPLDARLGFGVRLGNEERVRGMSPMVLCGIALAGANLPEDEGGRGRGLLTAEELSTLDLTGCELAVLSACDTNVGVRSAGQGVASLQKALHMAGARSVITSLWKVPDEATRELMIDFYRRIWVEKEPKGRALWEAKRRLREAQDERGRPKYTTRDWAAWILTGDPE